MGYGVNLVVHTAPDRHLIRGMIILLMASVITFSLGYGTAQATTTERTITECNACHNGGSCRTVNGTASCVCPNGTLGSKCEVYSGISNDSDNIARGKRVVRCKDGDMATNLGNASIWSSDACFNTVTNNVIIVELGEVFTVRNVTITSPNVTATVNISVFAGQHLAEGCKVMEEINCTTLPLVTPRSTITLACVNGISARYVKIKTNTSNSSNGNMVICIDKVSGSNLNRSKQQGHFSQINQAGHAMISEYKTSTSRSRLTCAQTCLTDPICLNFRWAHNFCSLYAAPPIVTDSTFRLHTFSTP